MEVVLTNRFHKYNAHPQLTAADVDGMKVAELKAALKERGLEQKGLKADLVERLKAHIASASS